MNPPDDIMRIDSIGDVPIFDYLCDCSVCHKHRAPKPRMPRPVPPSMKPLPIWQWVAGIVAGIVLFLLLIGVL